VLQGATAGAGMVVGRAIVRDRFHGADAQRVMSQVSMTFALAPAIAPVIGGWLQAGFGWRSVFFFLVLYSGVIWLLCRRSLPETLPVERRQTLHPIYLLKSYTNVLTSRPFLAICLASTFCFAGLFLYVAAGPQFLQKQLGVSSTGFFWLFGPLTAGMALGAWLSGRFAGRTAPAGRSASRLAAWAPRPSAMCGSTRSMRPASRGVWCQCSLLVRHGTRVPDDDAPGTRSFSRAARARGVVPELHRDGRSGAGRRFRSAGVGHHLFTRGNPVAVVIIALGFVLAFRGLTSPSLHVVEKLQGTS